MGMDLSLSIPVLQQIEREKTGHKFSQKFDYIHVEHEFITNY